MKFEPTSTVEIETEISRQAKKRQAGRYLAVKIPLERLEAASRLPGKALAVYLLVHYRRATTKQVAVTLPSHLLDSFGIDRNAKHRALGDLGEAGLVRVTRGA